MSETLHVNLICCRSPWTGPLSCTVHAKDSLLTTHSLAKESEFEISSVNGPLTFLVQQSDTGKFKGSVTVDLAILPLDQKIGLPLHSSATELRYLPDIVKQPFLELIFFSDSVAVTRLETCEEVRETLEDSYSQESLREERVLGGNLAVTQKLLELEKKRRETAEYRLATLSREYSEALQRISDREQGVLQAFKERDRDLQTLQTQNTALSCSVKALEGTCFSASEQTRKLECELKLLSSSEMHEEFEMTKEALADSEECKMALDKDLEELVANLKLARIEKDQVDKENRCLNQILKQKDCELEVARMQNSENETTQANQKELQPELEHDHSSYQEQISALKQANEALSAEVFALQQQLIASPHELVMSALKIRTLQHLFIHKHNNIFLHNDKEVSLFVISSTLVVPFEEIYISIEEFLRKNEENESGETANSRGIHHARKRSEINDNTVLIEAKANIHKSRSKKEILWVSPLLQRRTKLVTGRTSTKSSERRKTVKK